MTDESEFYKKIFEEAMDPIIVADSKSGIIEECNPAVEQMTGWSRHELIGRHQRMLHPPGEQDGDFSRTYRRHASDKNGTILESQIITRDGQIRDVLIKASIFRLNGRALILGFFHDTTIQKKIERERENIAKFPDENHNPVLRVDSEGNLLYTNRAARRLFENMTADDTGFPPQVREPIRMAVREGKPRIFEYHNRGKTYQFTAAPIAGEQYVNLYGADISGRISTEKALQLMEERSRLALKAANLGSWDWDMQAGGLYWSEEVESMLGFETGEFNGTFRQFLHIVHPEDRRKLRDAVNKAISENTDYELEHRIRRPDGEERWLREIGAVIRDPEEEPRRMIGIVEDITEKKKIRDRIDFLALHDPLTRLYNRLAFLDHVGKALDRVSRNNKSLALAYLDLDGFKEINDTLGHAAGDEVLREVASRFLGSVRSMDFVSRFGGDEFAILLQDFSGRKEIERIMRRLSAETERPMNVAGKTVKVGISLGVALYPEHAEDRDTLLKRADQALYEVKRQGGHGFRFYSAQICSDEYHRTRQ